jgi:hypothetical protein
MQAVPDDDGWRRRTGHRQLGKGIAVLLGFCANDRKIKALRESIGFLQLR